MNKTFKLSALALAAALTVTACNKKDAAAPAASAPAASGAEASAIGTPAQQASYAMGVDIGRSLKQMKDQGTDIDLKVFNEAIQTMYDGKEPKMNEMQAQEVMLKFLQEQQTKAQAKRLEDAKTNLEKGDAFLKENASKEGVKTTASGLQYKVIKEGTGKNPKPDSMVSVTYTGKLTDGTVFDSNADAKEPMAFPLPVMIKGWQEALPMMKEGAEYTLYIPPELGYGDAPPPNSKIPKNAVLIFDVKLAATGEMPKDAMVGLPQGQ